MRSHAAGQGATEYLVLLAVVLIIALVGIALLGFFPGTASDAQVAESQIYWRGAGPIAIAEWAARPQFGTDSASSDPYLRIRNAGAYPIRITKVLGAGQSISQVYYYPTATRYNISDLYYLAPGEEKIFNHMDSWPTDAKGFHVSKLGGTPRYAEDLTSADALCATTTPYGTLVIRDFGFEYIQYVEGQQITKREIGTKPLIIKCQG